MERHPKKTVNNTFYDDLHEQWDVAQNHPIALLRAENKARNPWILRTLQKEIGRTGKVLDIGCGAGFLCNTLAKEGYTLHGIDLSAASLHRAQEQDLTKSVSYKEAPAENLPFEASTFDAVCAMDLLEHVQDPKLIVQEASRVLKPGGLFFFHTFNRNPLSFLLIIKGVEWFVQNTPPDMHLYSLFLKPRELEKMCQEASLSWKEVQGLRPAFATKSFWKMLCTRKVDENFSFCFTPSLATGYVGYACKTL